MRRLLLATLLLVVAAPGLRAQVQTPAVERYADVRVSAPGVPGAVASRLISAGVGLDHAVAGKTADGTPALRTVLSESDIAAARAAGLTVEILTADLASRTAARSAAGGCPAAPQPITGSMGCYPTFDETLAILDAMRTEFPGLVSARTSIGTTAEGRSVWMIEVGDNPGVDEGEPEVLFTALHHAREPQGLSPVLLSLWDLLRSGDAEAQYLLANRRLFVVPVLNPDGYVYNQTTNPTGGGFWRKNRRTNTGGSRGVDLNRNYGYMWGYDDDGSSPSGSSETYRGPSAFSEPETAAIRDFVNAHRIRVARNYHSYGNLLVYPWGYEADLYTPDSAAFVDVARVMTAENGYLAGTGNQTVNYLTNGDSDDWMYGDSATRPAILSYTPEVGSDTDGFWPTPDRLVPIAEENLSANRYAMWVAGGAPAVARIRVQDDGGNGYVDPGETATVTVVLRNDGRMDLTSARARLVATSAGVTVVNGSFTPPATLTPGDTLALGPFAVQIAEGAPLGALSALALEVDLGGTAVPLALPSLTVGTPETVLADNASSLTGWTAAGGWGLSTAVFVSGPSSFADSPTGTYSNNTDRTLTRTATLDLTGTTAARLRFKTRWDLEAGYDVATVEVQVGSGAWTPLAGRYTIPAPSSASSVPEGTPIYNGTQTAWQAEEMDLSTYAGQSIRLRFRLRSDGSATDDGIYIDDLAVERLVDGSGTTATDGSARVATAPTLGAPAPNPTQGRVRLPFTLSAPADADVRVIDALGRLVATLHSGPAPAGTTTVEWDASRAAPGLYVVRLRTAAGDVSRRVVVR